MAGCRTVAVCFASLLTAGVIVVGQVRTVAQAQTAPNREVLACRLLPIAEVEALSGAKAAMPPRGYNSNDSDSTCTVSIANAGVVVVVSATTGAAGGAQTVEGQLGALRSTIANGVNAPHAPNVETKDYGDVGCLRVTFTSGPDGKTYDKPIHETMCLQLTGGYLLLHLASHDDAILSDEHVKALLAKAAEKRKALAKLGATGR